MISMKDKLDKIQLTQVGTENSEVFKLVECIGEGGQGAVYTTQRKNLLVKLSIAKEDADDIIKAKYRRYGTLRGRRDLPSYLAKPLSEITPIVRDGFIVYGYVMELMEDMVSLHSLFRKNGEKPTVYISRMGGIQRMYVILRKIAEILDGIHSIGYVYGDLNPNNVFISKDPAYTEVQLIDCDNLMVAADYDGFIYYPGYGAPEILKGIARNSSITDIWSYAVLAFYTLQQAMPFQGKMVMDAGTMELSQLERKAEAGELPFIDEDLNNAAAHALPKDVMESPTLQQLFLKAFGKDSSPISRPVLQEWIAEFQNWEHRFVKCSNKDCGSAYLKYKGVNKCPFCDEKSIESFVVCRKMIRHDLSCSQYDSPIIVVDSPVKVEIPISEYKMLQLEVRLDAKLKKVYIKQFSDEDITVEWSIKGIGTGKKVVLRPNTPNGTGLSVLNKEDNFLQFSEYAFCEGNKAQGVLKFTCGGLNG
ncbi:MAG: serine/threonine protein kinase [Fibrobacter sp.]|nr:serine/threonine protein kinase [Fibrobacter sp.]